MKRRSIAGLCVLVLLFAPGCDLADIFKIVWLPFGGGVTAGPAGIAGTMAPTGSDGLAGMMGATGATGATGPPGPPGSHGHGNGHRP